MPLPAIPPWTDRHPCKVCGTSAPCLGARDLSKWCSHDWRKTPLVGVPVHYHLCPTCGLLFTPSFDPFTSDEWKTHIYNDGYLAIDPDYTGKRAHDFAGLISSTFPATASAHVLDYGCGQGHLGDRLRQLNWKQVTNYDPFVPAFSARPQEKADLVFACEVLEHAHAPAGTFEEMASLRSETGVIIATTLLVPPAADASILDWWYVAPRNGHVTIHSQRSLELLATRAGLRMGSANGNLHFFWRKTPAWAAHVLPA